jgi:8-amino-3,8-dideoxy-alpha-D-manno-octulosonate transaminase
MIDRRKFLAGAGVGVSAVRAEPELAVSGGTPVRPQPLKASYWGPGYYGEEERQQLIDVLTTRRPFRWYGPGAEPPMKVATFEKEFAARIGTRYALGVTSGTAALHGGVADWSGR